MKLLNLFLAAAILSTPYCLAAEKAASAKPACSAAKAKQLRSKLDASIQSLEKLVSMVPSEEKSNAVERARGTTDKAIEDELDCIRKDKDGELFSKALNYGALACETDAYESGIDYLIELGKDPRFEKSAQKLKPKASECVRNFIKERSREMNEGNG